jgi:predicted Zn-dependent protease
MKCNFKNVEDYNQNVSKQGFFKDFILLVVGGFVLFFTVYWVLGFFSGEIFANMPISVQLKIEKKIGTLYFEHFKIINKPTKSEKLQEIVDCFVKDSKYLNYGKINAYVVKSNMVNAFALPGGQIYVTTALMNDVKSDKELEFVMAHELGHFAHRDHMKALGRKAVLIGFSIILTGENSDVTEHLINSIHAFDTKFSQKQEINADMWAVDTLRKKQHSIQGGITFMQRLAKNKNIPEFEYYFATHPRPKLRVEKIQQRILQNK